MVQGGKNSLYSPCKFFVNCGFSKLLKISLLKFKCKKAEHLAYWSSYQLGPAHVHLRRQQETAQMAEFLPLMGKAWIVFQVPCSVHGSIWGMNQANFLPHLNKTKKFKKKKKDRMVDIMAQQI